MKYTTGLCKPTYKKESLISTLTINISYNNHKTHIFKLCIRPRSERKINGCGTYHGLLFS